MEIEYISTIDTNVVSFTAPSYPSYSVLSRRFFRIQKTNIVFIIAKHDFRKSRNKRIGMFFVKENKFLVSKLPESIRVHIVWKQRVKPEFVEMITQWI